ncbi:hypothetical protein Bca52824_091933 [Brassica carinata]|uniref:Disease resistance R13L4/SHOC-2-like LRR domain-containing protein n=1 Tax=Brassica carinata TaxID=52824 RepID=A0A8X7NV06_BRACI|nr:hypothetical protein Bca52824_091933 [Brassica carinata]
MGNCMSFQPSCDATLDRAIRVLCSKGYIGNLKKNLRDLQRETEDLRAIQDVVKNKVAREKVKHRHMLKPVQVWLTRVESINTRADDILSTSPAQLQKLCLCGICSKNVCLSYSYGRRVFLLLEEVKKLKSEGNFQELTELTMICEVVERPTRTTVGQEEMLETAWERLMEEDVGIYMCSQLTTLLLQKNGLDYLSGEFIQSMQKLVVLDLSRNDIIGGLPEQISELASLQYLDVSYTNIRQLPASFRGLKKLTHVNLTGTERLCSIRGISKLSSLTSLKLLNSKVHGDVNLVKELQHLEHLQVLTISISTDSGLEELLGDQRLAKCIDSLSIRRLNITLDVQLRPIYLSLLMSMENLRHINVTNIDVSEIDTNENWRKSKRNSSGLHNPTVPYFFTNLSTVGIVDLNGMTDLTWLLFAPNLVKLHVGNSEEVKEIINKKKAKKVTGTSPPFQKLEMILLEGLPKLEKNSETRVSQAEKASLKCYKRLTS